MRGNHPQDRHHHRAHHHGDSDGLKDSDQASLLSDEAKGDRPEEVAQAAGHPEEPNRCAAVGLGGSRGYRHLTRDEEDSETDSLEYQQSGQDQRRCGTAGSRRWGSETR